VRQLTLVQWMNIIDAAASSRNVRERPMVNLAKNLVLMVALALGAAPALAQKAPPRSCEQYWTAAHACAYGHSALHCNQRRREHFRRECLREGGQPHP
jgi:predicted nucleic acid-binding protein